MGTTVSTLTREREVRETCKDMISIMTKQILAKKKGKKGIFGGGNPPYIDNSKTL